MKVSEAIVKRRTIRGFTDKEVPQEVIKEILELARHAPSNSNTQPWHIAVVSGPSRVKLEKEIFKLLAKGMKPNSEWPAGGVGLKGKYKQRQYDCGYRYYDSMGVDREDKKARMELLSRNWKFFGAPHAAFISMPKTMHRANAIDIGIFLQSLMLLMTERGIASCPQGALASFPDPVRAVVDIPEENAIIVGLSFGYEEVGAQINSAKMPRVTLDEMASFAN